MYRSEASEGFMFGVVIGDWDNLRVFLALAEEGSLTAAKRLPGHPLEPAQARAPSGKRPRSTRAEDRISWPRPS